MNDVVLPLALGIAASATTLLGGWIALHWSERLTLILGLAAGIVLGVAFFDLLPEALEMAGPDRSARAVLAYAALGFVGYLVVDRLFETVGGGGSSWRPHLGPAILTLHSFLDGVGIGLAFQVSAQIGWVVAVAVLTHDVADGINTVSLSLTGSRRAIAQRWLLANGVAPLLGVSAGLLVVLPGPMLAPFVAAFGGVFLFIGACELVPRSLARDSRLRVTAASLAGILLMLLLTHWAG